MEKELFDTFETLTEAFQDEVSVSEIKEILKLNLIKEKMNSRELNILLDDIEDLLFLKLAFTPGYFKDIYFDVVNHENFISQVVKKINKEKYSSLEEGLIKITQNALINILSEKINNPVNILEVKKDDCFTNQNFIDSSNALFGSLGKDIDFKYLYDKSELYSHIIQFNALRHLDQLDTIVRVSENRFRVYPSSVLQIKDLLSSNEPFLQELTIYDYIDILDSKSALFTIEFCKEGVRGGKQGILGFIYYSAFKAFYDLNPFVFSSSLEGLLDNTELY